MGIHRGPNTVKDGLVFGYDTGYGVADNSTATRFYPGQPTTNLYTNPDFSNGETGWTFSSWSSNSVTHTATTVVGPSGNIVSANKLYMGVNGGSVHFHQYNGSKYTSGNTYTTSAWVKGTGTFQIKSHWGGNTSFTMTGEWQRVSMTVTATSSINGNFPYFAGEGLAVGSDFYITDTQTELNSHVTPYVSGTRSSTASLIDLKRTTNIDVSNVSFDSTGQPIFDGTDDIIDLTLPQNFQDKLTIETWYKGTDSSRNHLWNFTGSGNLSCNFNDGSYTLWLYWDGGGSNYLRFTTPQFCDSEIHHIVFVHEGSTNKVYLDGVLLTNGVAGGTQTFNSKTGSTYDVGGSPYFQGDVYVNKVYDEALTASQVKQNFNAYKNRFDI